ncbi:cyclic AMP-dependent transcription factor ATF-6 alpha [Amia ocellicauda]|uniref:cyclic AMP-dependent transcription factor ATF-6 alpha n=1 Tax=Amia ocellicauda TaxID=2972642 RepID=UPI0034644C02
MATGLMLDLETQACLNQRNTIMNSDMYIDQDGEWDLNLFDELADFGDADDLLQALGNGPYAGEATDLDFDIDMNSWHSDTWADTSSSCTDLTVDSLSPNPTISSVSSPGSVDSPSHYSLPEELDINPQSQPSPVSVCSDISCSSDRAVDKKPQKRTGQTTRGKSLQPLKRPFQLTPKVSIQPKPVITAVPITHSTANTIIIQPVQTVLPVSKPAPVTIQPALSGGRPVMLSQPTRVVQLQNPSIVPPQPVLTLPDRVLTVPTRPPDRCTPTGNGTFSTVAHPVLAIPIHSPAGEDDVCSSTNVMRRQQRMIKNRESASLSRKKKKEYLLTLEARLKVALSENEKLKNENGSLKKQLEGLVSENKVLKVTAPKRRAVCVMVVLAFVMLNSGPMSVFHRDPSSKLTTGTVHSSRQLLGFSPENENSRVQETPEIVIPQSPDRSESPLGEKKALMVVKKEPLLFVPPPPCQPSINRTKSIKLANELRGWVHRHEVERTKSRRMTNSQHKSKTVLKSQDNKAEVAQIVTVQYTDTSDKNSGSELQVYYAPYRSYNEFFEEIHRRGDTFYVVSFRRDHLLLPATNHNKGSRPKMSVVLPAMNSHESVIKEEEYSVMMQIDCEVMDTRILHIKTSSIPPFLRASQANHTSSFYHSTSANSQAMPPVGAISGSDNQV